MEGLCWWTMDNNLILHLFVQYYRRWGWGGIWEGFFSLFSLTSLQPQRGEMMARFRAHGISCWPASHAEREKQHHTVIVKKTDQADTKWHQQLRDYDINSKQQLGYRSFQSAHIIHSWSVWFLSRTYLGLLVKVRGQLNQPRRLHCSHITHVVFWRLHHFVENHPGDETTLLVKEYECQSKCVSVLYVRPVNCTRHHTAVLKSLHTLAEYMISCFRE